MSLTKPTKKQVITVAVPLVVIIAAGAYILFSLYYVDNNSPEAKSFRASAPQQHIDTTVAEDVVTPSMINKDPQKYSSKTVKVKGFIVGHDKNYFISDQDSSKPVAFRLEATTPTFDFKPYAINSNSGNTIPGTVIVSGKFMASAPNTKDKAVVTPKILVESVK